MSKVGNLRAMFENKGETSPPERGRSPGGLSTGASDSPRPLSKIRTNFVAIEKDGRIGLQRDPSSDSILSTSTTRKASGEKEGEAAQAPTSQEKTPSFTDRIQKAKDSGLQMETIPQSPLHDTPSAPNGGGAGQAAGPSPGKVAVNEDKNAGEALKAQVPAANKTPKPARGAGVNGNGNATAAAVERDKDKAKSSGKEPPKAGAAAGATKPSTKLSTISTSKTGTVKPPGKSPTVAKTPTSPTKVPKLPSKTPETKALHPEKSATPKPVTPKATTATPKATTATPKAATPSLAKASAKPAPVQISPSNSLDRGVGFVKPKPKSPTRPVTLPAGLTTHTAASATRLNASRQSGSYQATHGVGRSPSRASVATATAGAKVGGTLKRQSSTINRPRPSLGPPPKQAAKDHPPTRRESLVNDDFLARMMRPTQASSSKTHEKALTPPRKVPVAAAGAAAKRPVTRDGASLAKKPVHKPEAVVKKVVPKATLDALAAGKGGEKAPAKEAASPVADKESTATEPTPVTKSGPEIVTPTEVKEDSNIVQPVAVAEPEAEASETAPDPAEPAAEAVKPSEEAPEAVKEDAESVVEEAVAVEPVDKPEEEVAAVNGAHEDREGAGVSETEPIKHDTPDAVKSVPDAVEEEKEKKTEEPVGEEELTF